MEQGTSRKRSERHRNKRAWLILTGVTIVLLGIGMWIWGRHGPAIPFDSNAVDSSWKPLTEGEMMRELQKQADASLFRFKMNTEVTVTADDAGPSSRSAGSGQKADWDLVNSIENSCNMEVSITGKDGTALYESRLLQPGEQELTGALKTHLEPGTYEAVAVAKAIDPKSGEVLGNVTAELKVTVTDNGETGEAKAETAGTTHSEG